MEITEEQRKNHKRFHIGKAMATCGAAILFYRWLMKKLGNTSNLLITTGNQEGCLLINDENQDEYIKDHEKPNQFGKILYVPAGITNIIFETTKRHILHNIMPEDGDYADGTRLRIFGHVMVRPNTGEEEEYQFSQHIYTDIANNNGGSSSIILEDQNGYELMCFRKEWWFII